MNSKSKQYISVGVLSFAIILAIISFANQYIKTGTITWTTILSGSIIILFCIFRIFQVIRQNKHL